MKIIAKKILKDGQRYKCDVFKCPRFPDMVWTGNNMESWRSFFRCMNSWGDLGHRLTKDFVIPKECVVEKWERNGRYYFVHLPNHYDFVGYIIMGEFLEK